MVAALTATLVLSGADRAWAQATGDGPKPSGTNAAAALDYVSNIFDPAGGSFDFDVDPRELQNVEFKKADNVHFSGKYWRSCALMTMARHTLPSP